MVSLISRSEYIRQFGTDEYSAILIDFLLNSEFSIKDRLPPSNAEDAAICALYSIKSNIQKMFSDVYEYISRRKPKRESDWINDDILLFALTLGICKFNLDKQWLIEVLEIRISHSHSENKLIAQTFIDILRSNLNSKDNCQPLMLVMKYYLILPIGDSTHVNSIYQDIIKNDYPYFKAIFLNLITLKAFDIILLTKDLVDWRQQQAITDFVNQYSKRIHQLATIFWAIILTIMVCLNLRFLYFYLFVFTPHQVELWTRILTFLPFIGIGGLIFPLIKYKQKIIKYLEKPSHLFLGFNLEKYSK
jgi:hypothetical protein